MVAMESSAPALTDSHQVSRKTNFSIAAIMSGLQARTETEAKLQAEAQIGEGALSGSIPLFFTT